MSYRTWHEYGYGICIDEMDKEAITEFDDYAQQFSEYIDEACETIINNMNKRFESVCFLSARDFDDKLYIIYSASYPWELTEKDKTRTLDDIEKCFSDYMSNEIGIKDFDTNLIEYQSIANGG